MKDNIKITKIKIPPIYKIELNKNSKIQLERSDIIRYNNAVREFQNEEKKFRKILHKQIN